VHLGLIIDEHRLRRDHAMVNRLAVGLLGEGVIVTRIVPDRLVSYAVDTSQARIALARTIETPMQVLPWHRARRAARLDEALGRRRPDVLYAMGRSAWAVGIDLARRLDVPLAVDAWSLDDARRAPRGRQGASIAAYFAPTPSLTRALGERVDPGLVCPMPVGIGIPAEPRDVLQDPERVAIAVVGQGRDIVGYRALLGGLSRIIRDHPQVQVFIELDGANEHEIWRYARQLGLLESVSLIGDAATHRNLLLRCDMLVLPEQFGELHTIVLEAMSYGLAIVTVRDPVLDMLEDGVTASVVDPAEPEVWARTLQRLLTDPDEARALGRAARERVGTDFRSTTSVACLVETLERLQTGGTYRFEAPEAAL
jgi:glycosyltransferase involved in cell wall biosynthesis